MLNFKLGHIGKNEIERAIKVLEENKQIKNIFVRVTHNDRVVGREYEKMQDLLTDDDFVVCFENIASYIEYIECSEYNDDDEVDEEILELLKDGKVYYNCENGNFSNDIEDIVKPIIEDGKSHMYYSYEDALDNLNGKYVNEALVVFLCNEY